ncbi:MAG: hypothetical protein JW840_03225 [Candidatus Thermoplasmatota archaeon]|nr:hypothetical protein [Candidatus Thermoplasmatota archaeon]
MKEKYVLGSILVILLMLVSTQTILLNVVKSDPTIHTGDADVGDLWISELNVAAAELDFEYIGIGHANASDDWVLWTNGTGNINASWSVDIGDKHPEFIIHFALSVYLANESIDYLGNDTYGNIYSEDTAYDEQGILTVSLEFTQQQIQEYSQTLVCILGVSVNLNNTQDAVNFSSLANDRCVVAVDFDPPQEEPSFSLYKDEANANCPGMWSWLDGWNESGRFDDEDDMLNSQTYFSVGQQSFTQGDPKGWDLGHVNIRVTCNNPGQCTIRRPVFIYSQVKTYPMKPVDHKLIDNVYIDYESHQEYEGDWPTCFYRYVLFCEGPHFGLRSDIIPVPKDSFGDNSASLVAWDSYDTKPPFGYISVWGWIWIVVDAHFVPRPFLNYSIEISEEGGSSSELEQQGNIYWEQSCAYQNESYDVEVESSSQFGITTIEANIIEALTSESTDEFVFTYNGDRGDTRIELICEE